VSHKRILIIDDDYRIREVTKLTLELMVQWEVLTASSGSEGLALAEAQQPDAILLDVMMPDLDGMATLERLKAEIRTRYIPVILLTAKVRATEQQIGAPVAGIISKPFDPVTLAKTMSEALCWSE